jgi:hypothetical protein
MKCYLLGTYVISPTIFGEPGIIVLGFLISLLFVPIGDVFWYILVRHSMIMQMLFEPGFI